MLSRHPRSIARLVAVLVSVIVGAAPAQDGKSVVLRYATVAPQRSVWGIQLERWSTAVEEESRGSVKVQIFYGGQLGAEADLVLQVARGRLDMVGVPAVFGSQLVPELQLLGLPTFFGSTAELDCVLDSGLAQTVSQRLADKGLHFDGWGGVGAINIIGKRAITAPSDLAGAKVGTFGSRSGALLWQELKANPTPTSNTEISSAFQTGLIDLSVTSAAFYVSSGLNKVAPVMSRGELFFVPSMHLVNKAAWDQLSTEQQAALKRARARVPAGQMRQEVRDFEARMLEAHVKGGGQLIELTAAQRDTFRKTLAPNWPRMAQEAGPEGPRFLELMEAARKACEGKT
jgi:TRAP-type transport system periplasmic protein